MYFLCIVLLQPKIDLRIYAYNLFVSTIAIPI